jgi:hypothetical protein
VYDINGKNKDFRAAFRTLLIDCCYPKVMILIEKTRILELLTEHCS